MSEALELKWTGPKRRRMVRVERREAGGWVHTEREFREGQWHPVGQELVDEVSVEVDRPVADVVDVIDAPPVETVRGPGDGRP